MNRKSSVAVEWSPRATKDIIEIYQYIARSRSPDVAEDTAFRLQEVGNKLRQHPLLWKEREGLAGIRLAPVEPYFICYHYKHNAVTIARIIHSKRDIVAIFAKLGPV